MTKENLTDYEVIIEESLIEIDLIIEDVSDIDSRIDEDLTEDRRNSAWGRLTLISYQEWRKISLTESFLYPRDEIKKTLTALGFKYRGEALEYRMEDHRDRHYDWEKSQTSI